MKRSVLFYGLALAGLIFLLKFVEYHFLVRDLSLEFYIGTVALLFTIIGIWSGMQLSRKKQQPVIPSTQVDEKNLQRLAISKREQEVLGLMAKGYSNQEIADKLFLSLNTVKTHSSNLFLKLDVKRRTQAVQKAKLLRLIP